MQRMMTAGDAVERLVKLELERDEIDAQAKKITDQLKKDQAKTDKDLKKLERTGAFGDLVLSWTQDGEKHEIRADGPIEPSLFWKSVNSIPRTMQLRLKEQVRAASTLRGELRSKERKHRKKYRELAQQRNRLDMEIMKLSVQVGRS